MRPGPAIRTTSAPGATEPPRIQPRFRARSTPARPRAAARFASPRAPISARPSCSRATSRSNSIKAPRCSARPITPTIPAKTEFRLPALQSLVSATNAENVAITGEGMIDGQGESWWQMARTVQRCRRDGQSIPARASSSSITASTCASRESPSRTRPCGRSFPTTPTTWSFATSRCSRRIHRRIPTPSIPSPRPTCASIISMPTRATTISPSSPAPSTRPAATSRAATSPSPIAPSCTATASPSAARSPAARTTSPPSAFTSTALTTEFASRPDRDRGNDVSNLVFRDIDMKNVKNPLVISEYYPRILPPSGHSCHRRAGHAPHAALPRHHV